MIKTSKIVINSPIIMLLFIMLVSTMISASAMYLMLEGEIKNYSKEAETENGYIFKSISMMSIGLTFGMAALASGIGIAIAGSAAISAAAEKPELSTLAMIITALAEAIAIYGLVVVIMMLAKI